MSALTDARARLAEGYYNSNPKTVGNPGGLAANGHQLNFPASLIDLGLVLLQAGVDAATLNATLPAINAVPGLKAAAEAAAALALQYRNEAEQIVGVDLTLKANLASPAFTGAPTAPTPPVADNSNRIQTTAGMKAWWATQVGSAPAALDAVYELAAAIGNNPNFATDQALLLAGKLDKSGGSLTGRLTVRSGANGHTAIVPPGGSDPGYMEFWTGDNVRRGYIGASNGNNLVIAAENGWGLYFSVRPQFMNFTPWDNGNLAPVDLANTQTITGQKSFIVPNQPMTSSGSVGTALMVTGTGTGPAMLSFHRPGIFATYFGLDSDSQLKVGGWSMGPAAHVIYHSGNDGSGSGLDADLHRGMAPTSGKAGNSIVSRDVAGNSAFNEVFSDGGVRITGTAPLAFQTYGGGLYMSDTTWVRVYADKSFVTGGTVQGGVVRETSDARLKVDYQPVHDAGDLVDRTVVYRGKKQTADGLIDALYVLAQDQRLVTPEVVAEGADIHDDGSPLLTVNYGQLALIAIAALQEERAAGRRRDRLVSELQLRLERAGL